MTNPCEHFTGLDYKLFYHNNAECKCKACPQNVEIVEQDPSLGRWSGWTAQHHYGARATPKAKTTHNFTWTPQYVGPVEKAFLEIQEDWVQVLLKENHNYKIEWAPNKFYYSDYAVPEDKIAIEVDEEFHKKAQNRVYDSVRQKTLENLGWWFIRVPQSDIISIADKVRGLLSTRIEERVIIEERAKYFDNPNEGEEE